MLSLFFGNSLQQFFSKTLTVVTILISVYLFLYFFSQYKPVQSLFYGVMFFIILASGVLSFGNLNIYYSSKGGVLGEISSIFEKNQVEIIEEENEIKFNFSNIILTKNSNGKYSASITSEKILKLDSNENYFINVNDEPCSTVICDEKDIYATYNYVFLNRDSGEYKVLKDDTMSFYFALYNNYSYLYIEVENGEETAELWNAYFNKNNFTACVFKVESSFYNTPTYKTIRYFSKDYEIIKTVKIKNNTEYIPAELNFNGITYKNWKLNNSLITDPILINENIDLIGLDYTPFQSNIEFRTNIDYWFNDLISNIKDKNYNLNFSINSTELSNYLKNKNFSKIEIDLNTITGTIQETENYKISHSSDILTISIDSNGYVSCNSKIHSIYSTESFNSSILVDNNIFFEDVVLNNDILIFNASFSFKNYLSDFQKLFPNKNLDINIFTAVKEILSLGSIRIYE